MTIEQRRQYDREWYHKNKERLKPTKKKNETKYLNKKREIIITHLRRNPCVDCGEQDIVVLEFDHRDPTTKVANIANLISGGTIQALKEEIVKCEVRCANCHRRKTAKQFNTYKHENML